MGSEAKYTSGYPQPEIKATATGYSVVSELLEGPHADDFVEGDGKLSRFLNTAPRQRVIATVHGTDDFAKRAADAIRDALVFVPWKGSTP